MGAHLSSHLVPCSTYALLLWAPSLTQELDLPSAEDMAMGLELAGSPPHVLAHSGGEKSLSGATHHSRVPWDSSPDTDGRSGHQNTAAQPHKETSSPVPQQP